MTSEAIKTVVVSFELQNEFATLSGDWNPMHMSFVAARRTPGGRPVVHGMHTVLFALESVAASSPSLPLPSKLEVRFLKPVYLEETVAIHQVERTYKELRLQAMVDGMPMADLRIVLGDNHQPMASHPLTTDDRAVCRELALTEMVGRSGTVPLATTPERIAAHFPNVVRWLGVDRVAALLSLSRLVGMECPGLHSLFSGFAIEFPVAETTSCLQYHVASVDDRFRLLKIGVTGLGIRGRVEAFARHPPIFQVPIRELSGLVGPNEFGGQRALIVGGSRGLGELTAKLLAAGGAYPTITYAVGRDDAQQVVEEIKRWGGECELLKYDVRAPSGQQLASLSRPVSYLYYYPTCQIHRRRTGRFASRILDEFLDFYVRGFYDLCVALRTSSEPGLSAFFPSSVAVEERPPDMTEYAMAKAAAEVLCTDLNQSWSGIHITTVRLPRLPTDQTATLVPTQSADPIEVILPIVRRVQAVRF